MNKKQIGKKTYIISDDVKSISNKVIDENVNELYIDDTKIEYIAVYPNITNTIVGRCIKANNELKYFSDADYIIEVSGDLWDNLDELTKYILLLHELKHIYVTQDKKGNTVYKLADYDVKDFYSIIKKYGIDWYTKLKTLTAGVYNLSPEAEDNIRL